MPILKTVEEVAREKAELDALNAILTALRPLDDEASVRILKTAAVFYGIYNTPIIAESKR